MAKGSPRGARSILAVVVTGLALMLQTRQFHQTISQQVEQFGRTEKQQAEAHEDTEWREALKSVSFNDPRSSMIGAFAMQGFFNSPRYSQHAREIASGLLANTKNVSDFDEILTEMREKTDASNMTHMTVVAQMLGYEQRSKYKMKGAASDADTPFLMKVVDEIDPNPNNLEHNPDLQVKIAAWEIDSISQFLCQLWRDRNKKLSPVNQVLTGTVLENCDFDNLDFSNSHLDFGILSDATFRNVRFQNATFRDLFVHHIKLEGADFSGVTEFSGSRWEDTNWWLAKCVPEKMLNYLILQTKHVVAPADRAKLVGNCN